MIFHIRIICIISAAAILGCTDSSIDPPPRNDQKFTSVSFSIRWNRSPENTNINRSIERHALPDDCTTVGVDTVQCKVYSGDTLLTSGIWKCSERRGTIDDIPPGPDRRFVIFGLDGDGRIAYRGQTDGGYECIAGATVTVGYIEAFPFVPHQLAPGQNNRVNAVKPTLSWNAVDGASEYHITVSEKNDLTEPVVEGQTPDTHYTPAGLNHTRIYYWHVRAADQDRNIGISSETSSFEVVPYLLPDTGQSFDATATIGEDTDYSLHPPAYTKLNAAGGELNDDATEWAMVRDDVTGLIWEIKTNDDSIHDRDDTYNFPDSQNRFIAALNQETYGGYANWRLPTVKELSALMQYSTSELTINLAYFPQTQPTAYWSSTPYVATDSDSFAWSGAMNDGSSYRNEKTALLHVRAVNDGSNNTNPHHLRENHDGTITDGRTGLMWQKGAENSARTWEEALGYCNDLQLAGHEDWRLPNIKELQSLVDYAKYNPAFDTYLLTGPSTFYWSSTTFPHDYGRAYRVTFYGGSADPYESKATGYAVRAVRGGQ